jgi:Ca-activated chloride channel family protein
MTDLLSDPKLRRFALLGAGGCFVGALLGQVLLAATRGKAGPSRAICLLIDASGSMTNEGIDKLREVRRAATGFVERRQGGLDLIAVVAFGSQPHRLTSLINDQNTLKRAVQEVSDGGSTAMDAALSKAVSTLDDVPAEQRGAQLPRSILLFTDGKPDNPPATLAAARGCREANIQLVAIGTGDADTDYLGQLTGDPKLVFHCDTGGFDEAFKAAEKVIGGGSLVESTDAHQGFFRSLAATAGWTALVALGLSLALVAGQNLYVHRAALTANEALVVSGGGLAAGLAGGVVAQVPYYVVTAAAGSALGWLVSPLGRVAGWAILGALVGRGLAWFVPNLDPRRALAGGAAGGVAGAVAFLVLSLVGETAGRLLGAALLGAAIGLMLAFVEAAFRQAWLEVRYGLKEVITVSLGDKPVRIGSDGRACQVYARGAAPLAFQYRLEAGNVICVDYATESSTVAEPGDEKMIGAVTVTVRASRQTAEAPVGVATTAPPPRIARSATPAPPGTVAPSAAAPGRVLTAPPPRSAAPRTDVPPAAASPTSDGKSSSAPAFGLHPLTAPPPPVPKPTRERPPAPSDSGNPHAVRPIPPPPPPREKT